MKKKNCESCENCGLLTHENENKTTRKTKPERDVTAKTTVSIDARYLMLYTVYSV